MKKVNAKELLKTGAKSILGEVPFIGSALSELIDYNSNIKQKRLINFIEVLTQYFEENQDVDIENIKTENFNDLFESVIREVVRTQSETKLNYFRNVLVKELKTPSEEIEVAEFYLELIRTLTDKELEILYYHRFFDLDYDAKHSSLSELRKNKNTHELSKIESELNKLKKYENAEFYNIPHSKFLFYKQRLCSKGLLVDNRLDTFIYKPFKYVGITELGLEFLSFIKQEENQISEEILQTYTNRFREGFSFFFKENMSWNISYQDLQNGFLLLYFEGKEKEDFVEEIQQYEGDFETILANDEGDFSEVAKVIEEKGKAVLYLESSFFIVKKAEKEKWTVAEATEDYKEELGKVLSKLP